MQGTQEHIFNVLGKPVDGKGPVVGELDSRMVCFQRSSGSGTDWQMRGEATCLERGAKLSDPRRRRYLHH